ncbi:MAG: RNA pseudouridine synthase [Opitutaceae bacterium]
MTAPLDTRLAGLPLGNGVAILESLPCGLVAFSKPAGILSHPNELGDEARSLLSAPYSLADECYQWKQGPEDSSETRRLWLLNRLDSATSGVILAAGDAVLASGIRAQFKKKRIRKVYCALVFGAPSVPVQVWRDRLSIDKRGGQIRTRGEGNIPCESAMQLVRCRRGQPLISLIRLEPRTGRSHQLRVQCALHGLPIVGDATYGDFSANRRFTQLTGHKRLFLHSLETSFSFEFQGREIEFHAKAPLPEEFASVMKAAS